MTLQDFFRTHRRAALAFSGGTDSAYLLYAAKQAGCEVRPYFVLSPFQPRFELDDALRVCDTVGVSLCILDLDVLTDSCVSENPQDRCYHCKRRIFRLLAERAADEGYPLLLDGTNASDDSADRPGMRAILELGVRSPLRECGVTKSDVRRLSRQAGLFTADKPSYACLATRVKTGERITPELLIRIEQAEDRLRARGYSDLRVRVSCENALLQLPTEQLVRAKKEWPDLEPLLTALFHTAKLDETPRQVE